MNEKLTPNNIGKDEFNKSNSDNDYKILINKLREIKNKIALLEKTILR